MTPKFYGFLWTVFAVTAFILWLGGVFSMLTLVVYGFIAFGLVFAGMICVLPGLAAHPQTAVKSSPAKQAKGTAVSPSARLRFH